MEARIKDKDIFQLCDENVITFIPWWPETHNNADKFFLGYLITPPLFTGILSVCPDILDHEQECTTSKKLFQRSYATVLRFALEFS